MEPRLTSMATSQKFNRKETPQSFDGWLDVLFFYRRSTPKGHIASKRLYKNTISHYELVWEKVSKYLRLLGSLKFKNI